MVARMSLVTAQAYALFVKGSTAPTSDVGPWLKNDSEWYVWDPGTAAYVPITLDSASLGYFIGNAAPNQNIYNFWIETAISGSPTALKIYYNGAWTDVYASAFAPYLTIAAYNASIASYSTTTAMNAAIAAALTVYSTTTAMNAAIAAAVVPYSTTTAMNAAIAAALASYSTTTAMNAAIAAATFASYPAQGVRNAQTITINGVAQKIAFDNAVINPAPAPFNAGTNRYTAPATGIYEVSFGSQFDNSTGTASGMEVGVGLHKNGAFIGNGMGDLDSTPSPNGSRWSPGFAGLVSLAATDYIEIFATVSDGVNTGDITLSVGQFSIHRVSA